MANLTSTRRTMLSAMALAPIAISIPASAIASTSTPNQFQALMNETDAAARRFNSLPVDLEERDGAAYQREEDRMISASSRADAAMPGDWSEFARWVEHIMDQGQSSISEKNADRLLLHVRRLSR